MTRFDEIPTAFEAPDMATPSTVVARIRAVRPGRRAVVRGLLIGAAAAALVPLDWYLARREAAAAPVTEGDDKAEHLTCTPESYREQADNWPASGTSVCYGGWRRGTFPCDDGYHREGSYSDDEKSYESTRLTTNCHGKNAWRWNGYRCSDATTSVVYADGTEYRGITIAACRLPGEAGAPSTSATPAPTTTRQAPSYRSDDETDEAEPGRGDDGGDQSRPGRDPSRPLLPALGSGLGLGR